MIFKLSISVSSGMLSNLNTRAKATTIKLIALFKITAFKAVKLKKLISIGSLNSAPPKPISPPKLPIIAPPKNAFMDLYISNKLFP